MIAALFALAICADPADSPKGAIVAVGGGATTPAITKRALELAGGAAARVLVIPQASERPDAGGSSATMWRELGAKTVAILDLRDSAAASAMHVLTAGMTFDLDLR